MVNSAATDAPMGKVAPKLISMKLDPKQVDDYAVPTSIDPNEGPAYPWGLCLDLNDDVLRKLGIPLPDVANTFTLVASVEVTRTSANKTKDGGSELSASLQITAMRLIDGNNAPDKAAKLWPDAT